MLADLVKHLLRPQGGVNNVYVLRVCGGYLSIALLDPGEEFHIFLFEAILAHVWQFPLASSAALQANLQRDSQKKYVIGLEFSDRGVDDASDGGQRQVSAVALVGDGGVKEPIQQDILAPGQAGKMTASTSWARLAFMSSSSARGLRL